jgi:uncharacterized protein (TIGR03437 family)
MKALTINSQTFSRWKLIMFTAIFVSLVPGSLSAATFGTVVSIGGQASDIALDESRRSLYISNFTANRIDVLSLDTQTISRSIAVSAQPGALALSPDGKYLVVTHYGPFDPPRNAVTIINLDDNSRRAFGVGAAPLAVSFGLDELAFVVTAKEFILLDPASGQTTTVETLDGLAGKSLPVEIPSLPPVIIRSSIAASRDGLWIYGLADKFLFRYDVRQRQLIITGYVANPELGPRTVSVSPNGSHYTAGWALFDRAGTMVAQFPEPSGKLETGSHIIDAAGGLIYAQVTQAPAGGSGATQTPSASSSGPVLQVVASDNLAVRERLQLRENLTGRSLITSARDFMYAVSDSGVTVLPIGQLSKLPRIRFEQTDVVFRNSACAPQQHSQEIAVVDASGGRVPFVLIPSAPGITLSQDTGVTPAVIRVLIDPAAFSGAKGTSAAFVDVRAAGAINVPDRLRVLVNSREPDQRGFVLNIPGKLVDILSDPVRGRFLVARENTNEVLVFDRSMRQIASLRTGNMPTHMAISPEQKYLIVGNDNSQVASVFDLDTLEPSRAIRFPFGHYPRSIAVSNNAILASVRSAGGPHTIDRIDMNTRTAYTLDSLGVFKNDVHINTALTASPDGASILIAMADGRIVLYDAAADTFVSGRKDFESLSGAYAASNYDAFIVDNNVLNSSLVPIRKLSSDSGSSSGFLFVDRVGFRTTTPGLSQAGMVQRFNLSQLETVLPTRMTESPLRSATHATGFTRTLAVLGNREGLLSLSTSGVTVLPWNYDAAYAPPVIDRVVNAADRTDNIAPGSLVTVFGSRLSPVAGAAADPTMADALAESCLTVNGNVAPVIFASGERLNAQIPWNVGGTASVVVKTPGGSSDISRIRITPGAPGVFRTGTAGPETGIPTIVRSVNNEVVTLSNPIHPGDDLVIYATGLGRTEPEVPVGTSAPFEPLARALNTPKVTLGSVDVTVYFAGLTPGLIGVYQLNVLIPRSVPTGFDIPLRIEQDGINATIAVRVVR